MDFHEQNLDICLKLVDFFNWIVPRSTKSHGISTHPNLGEFLFVSRFNVLLATKHQTFANPTQMGVSENGGTPKSSIKK